MLISLFSEREIDNETLAIVEPKFSSINGSLTALNGKFTSGLDNVNTNISNVRQSLADLERREYVVENQTNAMIGTYLGILKDDVTYTRKQVNKGAQELEDVKHTLILMQPTLEKVKNGIDSLNSTLISGFQHVDEEFQQLNKTLARNDQQTEAFKEYIRFEFQHNEKTMQNITDALAWIRDNMVIKNKTVGKPNQMNVATNQVRMTI